MCKVRSLVKSVSKNVNFNGPNSYVVRQFHIISCLSRSCHERKICTGFTSMAVFQLIDERDHRILHIQCGNATRDFQPHSLLEGDRMQKREWKRCLVSCVVYPIVSSPSCLQARHRLFQIHLRRHALERGAGMWLSWWSIKPARR